MKRMVLVIILVTCLLFAAGCSTRQVSQVTPAPSVTPAMTANPTGNLSRLPPYAFDSADITEAYVFATEHPEALYGVECHCGCMQTPRHGRVHTRGLIDCYFKEDGTYDYHAWDCPRCIEDTLEVKNLSEKGMSKDAINQTLVAKYEPGAVPAPTTEEDCSLMVTMTTRQTSP